MRYTNHPKTLSLTTALVCALASTASTQQPRLVADINSRTTFSDGGSPSPVKFPGSLFDKSSQFLRRGARVWFQARDVLGTELWESGGTKATTRRLFDLHPTTGSAPQEVTELRPGIFVFRAGGQDIGHELWITDGTKAGTKLLRDIWPGRLSSTPRDLTRLGRGANARIVFSATSGAGEVELWITDGTSKGTVLLKNINPRAGSHPGQITANRAGSRAFFRADDGVHGRECWVTDGSPAGTRIVADLNPGGSHSTPIGFTPLGADMLVGAYDPTHGYEVRRINATGTKITLVKDIYPGFFGHNSLINAVPFGGKVYFQANDPKNGNSLWVTDGTTAGTKLIRDLDVTGRSGTFSNVRVAHGKLWFQNLASATGAEPWVSDGTTAGTKLIADVEPGPFGSWPGYFAPLPGGSVVFGATTRATGGELWITDGTRAGTKLVKELAPGTQSSGPQFMTDLGNVVLFSAAAPRIGRELFVTDGTAAGTKLVANISPELTQSSAPDSAVSIGDKLYFSASDGVHGRELWVSDGTAVGTHLLVDLEPGLNSAWPTGLTRLGQKIVFVARRQSVGAELFVSDGTGRGTKLLADIVPGAISSRPKILGVVRDRLFFSAVTQKLGEQLYVTDGTPAGTKLFKKFQSGSLGIFARDFAELPASPGHFVFAGFDQQAGFEMFRSDGTPTGTSVVDTRPGRAGLNPHGFTTHGDSVWFAAFSNGHGQELWTTDGTVAGTKMFDDLIPGTASSNPSRFCSAGDKLFFTARTPSSGFELWVSDGTKKGTRSIDVRPGKDSSSPMNITRVALGRVMFTATTANGNELWESDGTVAGTKLVADIYVGGSSNPTMRSGQRQGFVLRDDEVCFSANDGRHGWELFAMPLHGAVVTTRVGCAPVGKAPRCDATSPRVGQTQEIFTSLETLRLGVTLIGAPSRAATTLTPGCDSILDFRAAPIPLDVWFQVRDVVRTTRLKIPRSPSLIGVRFGIQSFTLAATSTFDLRVSNGLEAFVGR